MADPDKSLELRVAELEQEVARLNSLLSSPRVVGGLRRRNGRRHHRVRRPGRRIRLRSKRELFGLPLWEVASGRDEATGERHGHARAIFAVGDRADGVVAVGGIARGGITIGGISLGLFSVGGLAFSLIAALGGVAIAPVVLGGVAVGGAARGGVAVGIYAWGRKAVGLHATELPDSTTAGDRTSRRNRMRDRDRSPTFERPTGME